MTTQAPEPLRRGPGCGEAAFGDLGRRCGHRAPLPDQLGQLPQGLTVFQPQRQVSGVSLLPQSFRDLHEGERRRHVPVRMFEHQTGPGPDGPDLVTRTRQRLPEVSGPGVRPIRLLDQACLFQGGRGVMGQHRMGRLIRPGSDQGDGAQQRLRGLPMLTQVIETQPVQASGFDLVQFVAMFPDGR